MPTEERLSGLMFVLLKRFVEINYDSDTWMRLIKDANNEREHYSADENYPVTEMQSIISKASEFTGLPKNELKEAFGIFLVPNLLNRYHDYVNPSWKTFEMLENSEKIMHQAVRRKNVKANPPALHVSKVSDTLLILDYHSKRRMAPLAVGIIKGIAKHYNESDNIEVNPVTNPNDERVQIRVNYIKK